MLILVLLEALGENMILVRNHLLAQIVKIPRSTSEIHILMLVGVNMG